MADKKMSLYEFTTFINHSSIIHNYILILKSGFIES
jgi:hypothetical protein